MQHHNATAAHTPPYDAHNVMHWLEQPCCIFCGAEHLPALLIELIMSMTAGAHILSGNVLEPHALTELLPKWKEEGAPVSVAVAEDRFFVLTQNRAFRLPTPSQMHNKGNFVISLR
jgi:hypothetical protein